MRVLICGSRSWTDRNAIRDLIRELPHHAVVIHGGRPRGADKIADEEAKTAGLRRQLWPADWHLHGKSAGPIRNSKMLKEGRPEFCFAFRSEGKSNGTDDMVKKCRKAGVDTYVIQKGQEPGALNLSAQRSIFDVLDKSETVDNEDGTYSHIWSFKED